MVAAPSNRVTLKLAAVRAPEAALVTVSLNTKRTRVPPPCTDTEKVGLFLSFRVPL